MRFGAAPSVRASASHGSGEWTNLLKKTASGGLSSAFGGGGGLLSAIGGLGGLISGIAGFFGGSKKTVAPLTPFQLPRSRAETVVVDHNDGPSQAHMNSSHDDQTYRYQSQQIAQAVKQALLNSSSLNDVIAEL